MFQIGRSLGDLSDDLESGGGVNGSSVSKTKWFRPHPVLLKSVSGDSVRSSTPSVTGSTTHSWTTGRPPETHYRGPGRRVSVRPSDCSRTRPEVCLGPHSALEVCVNPIHHSRPAHVRFPPCTQAHRNPHTVDSPHTKRRTHPSYSRRQILTQRIFRCQRLYRVLQGERTGREDHFLTYEYGRTLDVLVRGRPLYDVTHRPFPRARPGSLPVPLSVRVGESSGE